MGAEHEHGSSEVLTPEQEETILQMFDDLRKALKMLNQRSITELGTFVRPPVKVEQALGSLLIVFDEEDLSWANAKVFL